MANVFETPVYPFDYGYGGAIKIHRLHELVQLAHLTLVKEAANSDEIGWVYTTHRSLVHDTDIRPRTVRIRTWLSGLEGGKSTREYTIHDEADETLLFQRRTTSVALELSTLRPTNRDLSHLRYLIAGEPQDLPSLVLDPPLDGDSYHVSRLVEPDDIDFNRHVNNVAYIRWVYDAILRRAFEVKGKLHVPSRVKDLHVRYLRPLMLGDRVTLRCLTWENGAGGGDWKVEIFSEGADKPAAVASARVID